MSTRVAILGTGNIGTDLLVKVERSELLECTLFAGRSLSSQGMARAVALGVPVSDRGIDAITAGQGDCELVFDATNARDAREHWRLLEAMGKKVIDLTPAKVGPMCVPAVNLGDSTREQNLNMVTCGGQAAVPLAFLIGQTQEEVGYIEIVSSIASRSGGPATRNNMDEYIETTEDAVRLFAGAEHSKAILVLNPALPCVHMQTTVFATVREPDLDRLGAAVAEMVDKIQGYVPGYRLVVPPMYENGRIVIMVKVEGAGDYLPSYAGNLDIINCAAVAAAEEIARSHVAPVVA